MENLPYKASKSSNGYSRCVGCRSPIKPDELKIAAMLQSMRVDCKEEHWYHFQCFFTHHRPKSVDQIAYVENLHPDDQKKILDKVEAANMPLLPSHAGPSTSGVNPKKRKMANARLKDFAVEYAKSGRAACAGCGNKIVKDTVRVIFTSFETDIGKRYGGQAFSHHPECFNEIRDRYNYYLCGSALPGFGMLSKEDQEFIRETIQ